MLAPRAALGSRAWIPEPWLAAGPPETEPAVAAVIRSDSVRRVGVFMAVFGVSFALLVWIAGGVGGWDRTEDAVPAPDAPAPADDSGDRATMGAGSEARLRHDDHVLIGGERVAYRAWEARWAASETLPTADPEDRKRRLEDCVLHFFPRPTEDDPRPSAAPDGPGTTRISAHSGELTYRQGERPSAVLRDEVRVTQYRDDGEATLTTDELWCDGEEREAWSDDLVKIVDAAFELEGVGLRSDLGLLDLRLERDVRGAYLGRVAGAGGAPVPARITCSGSGSLRALDDANARGKRSRHRWLATFENDVVLVQGDDELRCDHLELEFVRGRSDAGGEFPGVERFLATGAVVLKSRAADRAYEVGCERVTGWREETRRKAPDGTPRIVIVQYVRFEGERVDMAFEGSLRRAGPAGAAPGAADDRLAISCAGGALMEKRPHPHPTAAKGDERITVTFREDVVAVHDEPAARRKTTMRAPKVTLYATRRARASTDPAASQPALVPETMTAEDGVRIESVDPDRRVVGTARVATWLQNPTSKATTFRLASRPKVAIHGVGAVNPFGGGVAKDADGWTQVTARTDLSIEIHPEPEDGTPARPESMVVTARDDVVVEQYTGETRIYRLEGDQGKASFDRDNEMRSMTAEGHARFSGWSQKVDADGNRRRGEAKGHRISVMREPTGGPGAPRTGTAVVWGSAESPAVATIHDLGEGAPVHEIHGEEIRYTQDGNEVEAKRNAHAVLRMRQAGDGGRESVPVDIRAGTLRAVLEVAEGASGARGPAQLQKVHAEGGVVIEGGDVTLTASEAEYDPVTGVAVATGRPARVQMKGGDADHASYVRSDTIRVFLDPSAEGDAKLRRASCNGGIIVAYLPEKKAGSRQAPRLLRVRVDATGPINLERGRASATGDVVLRYEEPLTAGRWREFVKVRCDSVDLEFDPDADRTGEPTGPSGAAFDQRLRRVRAVSTGERRVRVTSDRFTGIADEVVGTADDTTVRLSSRGAQRVEVSEKAPPRRFMCDEGSWNWVTNEWKDFVRFIALEDS